MARPIPNKNRIYTDQSIINDVSKNLVEIFREEWGGPKSILSDTSGSPLSRYPLPVFEDFNPSIIGVCDLPALFVWVDFTTETNQNIGQLVEQQRTNVVEEYIVNVQYLTNQEDKRQAQREVRHVGEQLRRVLRESGAIRGMMNGWFKVEVVDFRPDLKIVNGSLCPLSSVKIQAVFTRTEKVGSYQHR